MKKLLIFLIAILVLSTAVSAALTMDAEVLLGDEDQRRSNPEADDEDDEIEYTESTFRISSNETKTVEVTLDGAITDEDRYNVTLTTDDVTYTEITNGISFNITPTLSVDIEIRAMVPENLDSIDSDFEPLQGGIGTITAYDGTNTELANLKMQAENNLLLENVKVCVNDDCDNMDDGDDIQEIKPGDTITVEVEFESDLDDDENLDIEDVEITVESIDGDLEDFDDSDKFGDLGTEEKDTINFEFEIEDDQDKGTYEVYVIVDGSDENGARHGERWTIELQVEREKNDIIIEDVILDPSQVECGETTIITVDIANIGKNDVDDTTVSIKCNSLDGLYQKSTDYENVDENDEESFTFYIDVPEDQEAGQYRIDVQTYYDKSKKSDKSDEATESILLTVTCEAQEEPEEPEETEEIEYIQSGAGVKATLSAPVTFSLDGEQHTLSVSSLDAASESATVVVSSTPQSLSLAKGVPRKVDLDADGKNDLMVTLLSVSQEGVVELQIQEITYGTEAPSMVVTSQYTGAAAPTGAVVVKESAFEGLFAGSGYIVTLAIIDLIILIVAVVLISRAMKKR